MKIQTAAAGMMCLTALATSACVMPSTYDKAIADLTATKAEVANTRTEMQALTEQVSELEQLKGDLAGRVEAASSALELAKQRMKAERTLSQERLGKLAWAIGQLTAQQNKLRYALQRANEERPALQSVVERYKSQLGEPDGLRASVSPIVPSSQQPGMGVAPPAQVTAQADPAPKATVTAPPAPVNPAPASQNPQPPNKQLPEPVDSDWLTLFKGWIMSLWQSIFS